MAFRGIPPDDGMARFTAALSAMRGDINMLLRRSSSGGVPGPPGPAGAAGATGATGATGPAGPAGPQAGADRALIQAATTQAIATATLTTITLGTTVYDTNTMKSGNTLVAKVAGLYIISLLVGWEINATGVRFASLQLNGADIAYDSRMAVTVGAQQTLQGVTAHRQLVVNDVVQAQAFQTSGINLNVGGFAYQTALAMALVST